MIIKFHKICLAACPCIPNIYLIVMFPVSCKEEPLTEYEKVRARNIMRNNRMFQSLGIGAIASMIRKTNGVQEVEVMRFKKVVELSMMTQSTILRRMKLLMERKWMML